MIISHRHKFIFIKTRKTAGTSIQVALEKYCDADDIICEMGPFEEGFGEFLPRNEGDFEGHDFASLVQDRLGEKIWDKYFKFAFVRNPWDKLVSQYWFDFPKANITFGEYLRREVKVSSTHLSNWYYYTDKEGKEPIVDFTGRYEKLQEHYDWVCAVLGIPSQILPVTKSGFRPNKEYQSYYKRWEHRIVNENHGFIKEATYFGYLF